MVIQIFTRMTCFFVKNQFNDLKIKELKKTTPNKRKEKMKKQFTLIELLVVVYKSFYALSRVKRRKNLFFLPQEDNFCNQFVLKTAENSEKTRYLLL